jgi:hypothetical protein
VKSEKARVFNWSQRHSWERAFRRLLADKITGAVIEEARRIHPRSLADDNFAWLNTLVATVTHQSLVDIPSFLASRLSSHYEFMVAFHGTRSSSAADFLDHGIKLSDIKALNQRAVDEFGDSVAIQTKIDDLRQCEEHDNGKIFLALTKDACLRDHPQYMRYGSEQVAGLARSVGQLAKLEARGKPMIVECRIPTSILESEDCFWRSRSFAMLEDYFTRLLRPLEKRRVKPTCEIAIRPITPENILRVHEFTEIKRPFRAYNPFTGATNAGSETTFRKFKIWPGRARQILTLNHQGAETQSSPPEIPTP